MFSWFFETNPYMPHGHCYLWQPPLVWLHVISDAVTAFAYYLIPIVLVLFARKRKDLPFDWVFLLFSAFILACGTTHIMSILTLWHPYYWLSGTVKAVCALISLATGFALIPLFPRLLAVPSPKLLALEVEKRRIAEAELELKLKKLNMLTVDLEAFCYSVSHDMRAPLRTIDGYSFLLNRDYKEKLPPQAQEFLFHIQDKTEFMGKLIEDLLRFSRLGKQSLKIQHCDTKFIVERAMADVLAHEASLFPKHKIETAIHDLPTVKADPSLISQVFINLLGNAVKYSRTRELSTVEVGFAKGELYVKDNGVGFDMKYADKIFGVFKRLHTSELYEGTGVGLAIVFRIIENHGGSVRVESEVGVGSTFFITLPELVDGLG